jgi:hypothetical protein
MSDLDGRELPAPGLDAAQLTASLQKVAAAFDQARALGLPVSVPAPLYRACLEVIHRHDLEGDGTASIERAATRPSSAPRPRRPIASRESGPVATSATHPAGGVEISSVPLRRLVWQVINPGEEFTVTEVAERISALGASWTPSAVSNALGYWASRGRLTRRHKGAYSYPQPLNVAAAATGERAAQQETPAASPSRAVTARGEEEENVSSPFIRGKAAS